MYNLFLTDIQIEKVRHLEKIEIPLSETEKKHLILTGKNGSGKTSVLEALSGQLHYLATRGDFSELESRRDIHLSNLKRQERDNGSENASEEARKRVRDALQRIEDAKHGLSLRFSQPMTGIKSHFEKGEFILAYYQAKRTFGADIPKHVEKVDLKDQYQITDHPRKEFVKYLLDMKMTEALARTSGKDERADQIHAWFTSFDGLMKRIFEDESICLRFDEETFAFSLWQEKREPFSFNELSDGYAAVLDIVVDLMIRMQKHMGGKFQFELPGIVLIDEIETHLHLELQRKVLDFLESVFPNIQFIVTTHSPFILSSAKNAVIYDLEKHLLVTDGLTDLPYDGIVKGYFGADLLSLDLRRKYERYKTLVKQKTLSDDDMREVTALEMYLDEIPDYLAIEIATEYRRLKTEFEQREDLL